ncbi:MAG: BolA/IbaG family iron-sulfur metabolism protein [Gammaproteobacteria bacterium]|nr:BolA/IbaG family iron-sulfur metabolism protein [Gammaproteobacteria bacterium]
MSLQEKIEQKIADALPCKHLEVINESNKHNVPPGSESHFKVVLVSDAFDDQKLIVRHRQINKILAEELEQGLHALAMHTYTETEWREQQGDAPMSPPCRGGG